MSVIWAWFRIDALRRWRSLVILTLLIAASAATVLTAVAGARRGETALHRLVARTLPATAEVVTYQPGFDWAPIREMPEVEAIATYAVTDVRLAGIPLTDLAVGNPPADPETMTTLERPVVLKGRLADQTRIDEAVVTEKFVRSYAKGVGDAVTALFPTPEAQGQIGPVAAGPAKDTRVPMTIVGVVRSPWFSDGPQHPNGTLYPTAALVAGYRPNLLGDDVWLSALVRLKGGRPALPAFKTHLAQVTGQPDLDVRDISEQQGRRQHAASFEARWLLAFGAAALLASLALIGQAVARHVAAGAADLRVLRALGMTRSQATAAAAAGPFLAAIAGAGGGVAAAVALSGWFPIGSAATAEPAPGVHADWLVLGIGWLAIALLVLAGSAAAARLGLASSRSRAQPRRSSIAAATDRAHLPVPMVVGARFALEPGRGRDAIPVRPALVGAVAGVLGIVAAFTFSAGVTDAARHPERFGLTWQLETWMGFAGQEYTPPGLLAAVAADPDVVAVNDWRAKTATAGRDHSPLLLYSYAPAGRPVRVVLASGRMPVSATEVVLAPQTARALDAGMGSSVSVTGSGRPPRMMTVSGIAFVPAGSRCSDCSGAQGGWVTDAGFDSIFDEYQFHAAVIALRPEARVDEVAARLQRSAASLGGENVFFAPPYAPSDAAEIQRVQAFPFALGCFLALLALGAVGHALAVAVPRRQHDLAVLRALGMTRWQCRSVVLTQATLLALIGLVVGIPLGLAAGRTLWRAVADGTPLQYVPPRALLALLLVPPLALLAANLLAVWPGQRAARLHIAQVLRAE
ncbi:MAG: ABC transporter permease [Actinomycetota bacterium]